MTTSPEPLTTEEMKSALNASNYATIHDIAASAGLATLKSEASRATRDIAPTPEARESLPRR